MIRSIDNVLYHTYKNDTKSKVSNNTANNSPTFTGDLTEFVYKSKVLRLNGKKFSGRVGKVLADGSELEMNYLKGILQSAKRYISRYIDRMILTKNGATTEKVKIPDKVIYSKDYKYDKKGELISVKRNNIEVFNKRYKFNVLSQDEPIIKEINYGDINIFYDKQNRPKFYNIMSKLINGAYQYEGSKVIEKRFQVNRDIFQTELISRLNGGPEQVGKSMYNLSKEIVRDNDDVLNALIVTNCDDMGKPVESIVKDILGNFRYRMTYDYNKRGMLFRRTTHRDDYKFEEYLNKSQIAVATKLINPNGVIIEETKRDLFKNTNIMYRETTTHRYLKEHITTEITQNYSQDVNTYTTRITMPDSRVFKRVTRVNNQNNWVIDDKFTDDFDHAINPGEYLMVEAKVANLNTL